MARGKTFVLIHGSKPPGERAKGTESKWGSDSTNSGGYVGMGDQRWETHRSRGGQPAVPHLQLNYP